MKYIVWFIFFGLLCCGCAAERRAAPPTEYKVIKLDPASGAKELTSLLNEQAREGWEYVGPLNRKDDLIVLKRSPEFTRGGATAKTTGTAPKTTEKRNVPPDKE